MTKRLPWKGDPFAEEFFYSGSACQHERIERVAPLYVDGRPLHRCVDCDARFVYDADEPSYKALVPLAAVPPNKETPTDGPT